MLSNFLEILKDEKIVEAKSWFYNANVRFSIPEDILKQWTYRGKIGYKFSDRLLVNVYGTRSNIASTTAA
jgi:hypothetical protein